MSQQLSELIECCQTGTKSFTILGGAQTSQKNDALQKISQGLEINRKTLIEENGKTLMQPKMV